MPEIQKKRKRAPKDDSSGEGPDAMEVLRRHFESQFAPLPEAKKGAVRSKTGKGKGLKKAKVVVENEEEEEEEEEESEWGGVEDSDDDGVKRSKGKTEARPKPQIITFTGGDPLLKAPKLPKSILKPLISSKPLPLSDPAPKPSTTTSSSEDDDETTEANLLKNDLALQRLLAESHLLDSNLEATGKNRIRAIEARVQALGGKDLTKHKMPMLHRKGMLAAQKAREVKRRAQAKEAGIVLEKEVRVKKSVGKRDRGFGPSIGKFSGGTLRLSRRDVMEIEGSGGGGGKGKGSGGKGGKKGGKGKKRR